MALIRRVKEGGIALNRIRHVGLRVLLGADTTTMPTKAARSVRHAIGGVGIGAITETKVELSDVRSDVEREEKSSRSVHHQIQKKKCGGLDVGCWSVDGCQVWCDRCVVMSGSWSPRRGTVLTGTPTKPPLSVPLLDRAVPGHKLRDGDGRRLPELVLPSPPDHRHLPKRQIGARSESAKKAMALHALLPFKQKTTTNGGHSGS
ncbi:hypothetical protein B0T13DRAFT_226516 [Neurospora crassa]|nr:hypothetical protein B0T13DRAFT_226516 [Neurospora crassa]